jgi:hypothetical protein
MKLLACLAIVWIVKDSYIFSKPREYLKNKSKHLKELFSCSLCLGFWAGVILVLYECLLLDNNLIDCIYYPFSVSAFCWFFDSVLDMIQEIFVYYKTIRENKK